MTPLDGTTRARVTQAIARAISSGRDIAEYLNSYGLVASYRWKRTVQADAIATLAERMMRAPATVWHTDRVASWLQREAEEIRKGRAMKDSTAAFIAILAVLSCLGPLNKLIRSYPVAAPYALLQVVIGTLLVYVGFNPHIVF